MSRPVLEQVEASARGGDDVRPLLAWLAGQAVALDETALRGPIRRALLLLATGGDPRRALELEGRAVTALAGDLDEPGRRAALARGLRSLRAEASGLATTEAALEALLADPEIAWRSYAAGLLGEELADEGE